jgi:hypothetical protein
MIRNADQQQVNVVHPAAGLVVKFAYPARSLSTILDLPSRGYIASMHLSEKAAIALIFQ